MKKIQNWEKFNELHQDTYDDASSKLRRFGHGKRADRLSRHPREMEIRKFDEIKDKMFPDVEPFELVINYSGEDEKFKKLNAEIGFFDIEKSAELFDEDDLMYIKPYFKISGKVPYYSDDEDKVETDYFLPFQFFYNEGKIIIDWAQDKNKTPWADAIKNSNTIKFSNRKDAARFMKILRNFDIRKHLPDVDQWELSEDFAGMWDEAVSNIRVNAIYESE